MNLSIRKRGEARQYVQQRRRQRYAKAGTDARVATEEIRSQCSLAMTGSKRMKRAETECQQGCAETAGAQLRCQSLDDAALYLPQINDQPIRHFAISPATGSVLS